VGKGLEPLVEGLRRQVVYVEARGEPHWVESIKIEKAAEPEELGSWTG
jgi:hypothetical protein